MKKIISEFLENTDTIERKASRAVSMLANSVLSMGNLIRCKEIIKKLPEGAEVLQRLKDDHVKIVTDPFMQGGGAYIFDTCVADDAPKLAIMCKSKIAIAGDYWGMDTGRVIRDIFHESQHQKQFQDGLGWPDTNNYEDFKIWRRLQEADAESFAMAMSHQYAQKGRPEAWKSCQYSIHRHIAKDVIAQEQALGRDLTFAEVRKTAFDGWFTGDVGFSVVGYDQDAQILWDIMRSRHQSSLKDETQTSELTINDFKKFNTVAGIELLTEKTETALRSSQYFAEFTTAVEPQTRMTAVNQKDAKRTPHA